MTSGNGLRDLEAFWGAIWDYFQVRASAPYTRVLARRAMPGAQWFPGTRLNYAEHALAHEREDTVALIYGREGLPLKRMGWTELAGRIRVLATRLRELGVRPGDRVVAVLPNSPEAVIASNT